MRRGLLRVIIVIGLFVATLAPAQSVDAATFCDVPPGSPYYDAVTQLAARGVIGGYDNGCFGPGDATLRAQMAALIARAMGWNSENYGTPFPDRGTVDDNLWRNVGTLAHYDVARGYQDGTYQPTGTVLYAQTISFISRAMVAKQLWTARSDNPALYPNVPASSGHRADIATFVANAGRLPGSSSTTQQWPGWDQPATRAWFAVALWQALNPAVGTPPVPATAQLTLTPTSGPSGTVFTVRGYNFPAGATGTWSITGGGVNTYGYQLAPTQTSLETTITTTDAGAGSYTVSFSANGWFAASATFSVTGGGAGNVAQYKTAAVASINGMYYALDAICPNYRCTIYSDSMYIYQAGEYGKYWNQLNALGATVPTQCQTLHSALMQLSYGANGYVNAGLAIAQNGSTNFLRERDAAAQIIFRMNQMLFNEPGTCR